MYLRVVNKVFKIPLTLALSHKGRGNVWKDISEQILILLDELRQT